MERKHYLPDFAEKSRAIEAFWKTTEEGWEAAGLQRSRADYKIKPVFDRFQKASIKFEYIELADQEAAKTLMEESVREFETRVPVSEKNRFVTVRSFSWNSSPDEYPSSGKVRLSVDNHGGAGLTFNGEEGDHWIQQHVSWETQKRFLRPDKILMSASETKGTSPTLVGNEEIPSKSTWVKALSIEEVTDLQQAILSKLPPSNTHDQKRG